MRFTGVIERTLGFFQALRDATELLRSVMYLTLIIQLYLFNRRIAGQHASNLKYALTINFDEPQAIELRHEFDCINATLLGLNLEFLFKAAAQIGD